MSHRSPAGPAGPAGPRRRSRLRWPVPAGLLSVVLAGQVLTGPGQLGPLPAAQAEPPAAAATRTTAQLAPVTVTATAGKTPPPPLPANAIVKQDKRRVAVADDLMVSKVHANGAVSDRWAQASADLSRLTDSGDEAAEDGRPLRRPFYPSVAARPLGQQTDRTLSFRLVEAGDAGLWQLGSTDVTAEPEWADRHTGNAEPQAGKTYALSLLASNGGTLGQVAGSAPGSERSATADLNWSTGPRQQWTLLDGEDGWFRLVNVSDGLCLSDGPSSGQPAIVSTCQGGGDVPPQHRWRLDKQDTSGFGGFNGYALVNQRSGRVVRGDAIQTDPPASPVRDGSWQLTEIYEAGGVVPTWSVPAGTDVAAGAGLAAGDLDSAVDDAGSFHDEAAVAFVEDDNQVQIRVIDYADGGLRESGVTLEAQAGGAVAGAWRTGSLNVAVGDFAGDEGNEIAVTRQNARGEILADILRYTADEDDRALTVIAANQHLVDLDTNGNIVPSLVTGMVSVAAGDFDGRERDELAVFYGAGPNPVELHPRLTVVAFDESTGKVLDRATEAAEFTHTDPNTLTVPDPTDPWISRGPEVVAGLFKYDPDSDVKDSYGLFRRQLAVAWSTTNSTAGEVRTYLGTFTVKPSVLTLSLLKPPVMASHTRDSVGGNGGESLAHKFPLSLTAGGLRGIPAGKDPAVEGVAVADTGIPLEGGGWQTHLRMFDVSPAGDIRLTYLQSAAVGLDDLWSFRPAAYDRSGRTLHLGAPIVLTLTGVTKPTVLAAQPPAHADWLNGAFVNVSREPDLSVTMSRGAGTETEVSQRSSSSTGWGVTSSLDLKETVTVGVPKEEEGELSVETKGKVSKQYEKEQTGWTKFTTSTEVSTVDKGDDDDVVKALVTTYRLFRYPVIGAPVTDADGTVKPGARGVYEVLLPGVQTEQSLGGKAASWYQPTWQNGNALSYPQLDKNQVPVADAGSYDYTVGGTTTTSDELLYSGSHALGSTSGTVDLAVQHATATGTSFKSSSSLVGSQEAEVGVKVTASIPPLLLKSKFELEATLGFDQSSAESQLLANENSTTVKSGFMLDTPQIDATKGYTMGTTYYNDTAGVAKVRHGVNLTGNAQGATWWSNTYGKKADLALNLPFATAVEKNDQDLSTFNLVKWVDQPDRQRIRGFYARQVDPSQPAVSGVPYVDAAKPGDKVRFEVQVHNYSLKSSEPATAQFYAVPVDTSKEQEQIGEPQPIGQATVPSMGPQGMASITAPEWSAQGPAEGSGLQDWRIFVVLDARGQSEIHPLTGGEPCPATSIKNDGGRDAGLTDPMTGEPETLACGQNNQGYGEFTVDGSAPQAGGTPADVDLDGASLVEDGLLGAPRGVPTVVVGEQVRGMVHARSTATTGEGHHVLVYDGDPDKGGRQIAATLMTGVDGRDGGHADFTWQPRKPGRHVLYQRLLRADGTVDEQKFQIKVLHHGDPERLVLRAGKASLTAGTAGAFTATTADVFGNEVDDVTARARFTIKPKGSCTGSRCTATQAGRYTVTATYRSMTDTTSVTVKPGRTSKLRLSPARVSVASGKRTAYGVRAYDRYGNLRGDVSTKARLSIKPNGSCRRSTCWATKSGRHTVTATYAGVKATARLVVRRR